MKTEKVTAEERVAHTPRVQDEVARYGRHKKGQACTGYSPFRKCDGSGFLGEMYDACPTTMRCIFSERREGERRQDDSRTALVDALRAALDELCHDIDCPDAPELGGDCNCGTDAIIQAGRAALSLATEQK